MKIRLRSKKTVGKQTANPAVAARTPGTIAGATAVAARAVSQRQFLKLVAAAVGLAGAGQLAVEPRGAQAAYITGPPDTIDTSLTVQGNLTVQGGEIYLGKIGAPNLVRFTDAGTSSPGSSAGWKLQLWQNYGLGIDAWTLWSQSVMHHKWYVGNNLKMHLDSVGNLFLPSGNVGVGTASNVNERMTLVGKVAFASASGEAPDVTVYRDQGELRTDVPVRAYGGSIDVNRSSAVPLVTLRSGTGNKNGIQGLSTGGDVGIGLWGNLSFDGVNYNLDAPAKAGSLLAYDNTLGWRFLYASAGTNPVTPSALATVKTSGDLELLGNVVLNPGKAVVVKSGGTDQPVLSTDGSNNVSLRMGVVAGGWLGLCDCGGGEKARFTADANSNLNLAIPSPGTALVLQSGHLVTPTGNVGIGLSDPSAVLYRLHIVSSTNDQLAIQRNVDADGKALLRFLRSKGSATLPELVTAGLQLGGFVCQGYDGTDYQVAAEIRADVDATPGTNNMPGRLVFLTTPVGFAAASERMRIDSKGDVGIGTTTSPLQSIVTGRTHLTIVGSSGAGVFETGTNENLDQDGVRLGLLQFVDKNSTTTSGDKRAAVIVAALDGTTPSNRGGRIEFLTKADGGVLTQRMRITNTGNVGIGTTNPTAKLEVAGEVKVNGLLAIDASAVAKQSYYA